MSDLLSNNYSSKVRNKLIARAFKEVGIIEKYGSGIKRVFDICKNHGIIPPILKEEFNGFSVVLYKEKLNVTENELAKREVEILKLISKNSKITQHELSKLVGISPQNIRKYIYKLKNKGKLKRIGPDKGGYWEVIKLE